MNLAQRKKRRLEHRKIVEATWRLSGDHAAVQKLVNEIGRPVRCPACNARGWNPSRCAVCRGPGVLRPHREGNERCRCRDCEKRRRFEQRMGKPTGDINVSWEDSSEKIFKI